MNSKAYSKAFGLHRGRDAMQRNPMQRNPMHIIMQQILFRKILPGPLPGDRGDGMRSAPIVSAYYDWLGNLTIQQTLEYKGISDE